jgi:hypothetical protein
MEGKKIPFEMENKKKMKNILDGGDGGFLALTIV